MTTSSSNPYLLPPSINEIFSTIEVFFFFQTNVSYENLFLFLLDLTSLWYFNERSFGEYTKATLVYQAVPEET